MWSNTTSTVSGDQTISDGSLQSNDYLQKNKQSVDPARNNSSYSSNYECLACGYHITYPVYHPEDQPLAALHLPRAREEACTVLTYPMHFRSCAFCGHVFNVEFDYHKVPYEDNSNLMYNGATLWRKRMKALMHRLVHNYDLQNKTLIDIGCGDGGFLKLFREAKIANRYIGFEPGIESDNACLNGLEVYKDYFHANRDLAKFKPDVLFCRHVLEHLQTPRSFVADIAHWCAMNDLAPLFIAEVPRIDKAMKQARMNDYLYEHVSNFSEYSFQRMFEVSGFGILELFPDYFDEVTVAVVKPLRNERLKTIRSSSSSCSKRITAQQSNVRFALNELLLQNKTVAFWGATGKGASFLNGFDIFDENFPIVVDSDYNKAGRYVPRTAQLIRTPEHLMEHPVAIIVITSQWRAKDIFLEIRARSIPFEKVMVVLDNNLTEYNGEDI